MSHDNSLVKGIKDYKEQINNVDKICEYWKDHSNEHFENIKGIMIESNIEEGKQKLTKNLKYGVSITDGCISLVDTFICIEKINNCFNNYE